MPKPGLAATKWSKTMAFSLFKRKKDKPGETPAAELDAQNPLEPGADAESPAEPDRTDPDITGSKPSVEPGPGGENSAVERQSDAEPKKKFGIFDRFKGASAQSDPDNSGSDDKGGNDVRIESDTETGPKKKPGMFTRLKSALGRTRTGLVDNLADFLGRRKTVDGDLIEEIETLLLTADVGIDATQRITDDIAQRLKRRQLDDTKAVFTALRENMSEILAPVGLPLIIPENRTEPFVILVVGVNGAGKTTTIGKLAKRLQADGLRVMLAAGDTFRAAAVEQIEAWGERNDVPVIAQKTGADSASVIYDALQSAKARQFDVLIADTAGRLHTQVNLMEELKKVRRVITKLDDSAPHETLLVLDAGTGQNALAQARQFHEALGLTGIALTKLDGTAKGGIIFAIAQQLVLPIRFIGVGEGIDDLREFHAGEFIDALFSQ